MDGYHLCLCLLYTSHNASLDAVQKATQTSFTDNIPNWDAEGTEHAEEMILITQSLKEVQQIMSNYVGIVRSELRLKRAFDRLEDVYKRQSLYCMLMRHR